ncbi:hypothetical protein Tco_0478171 [Tanacetum coccineum]
MNVVTLRSLIEKEKLNDSDFLGELEAYHQVGFYKGFHIDDSLTLSHLFYADDVVFVGKWDKQNVTTIVNVLKCFFLASGLKINLHESKLMGIGIPQVEVRSAAESISCSTFVSPFNFLGVKVGGLMSRHRKLALIGWQKVLASKKNSDLGAMYGKRGALDSLQAVSSCNSPWTDIIREFKRLSLKEVPLKLTYPRLFSLELDKNISIADKTRDTSLISSFRRVPRGGIEEDQDPQLVAVTPRKKDKKVRFAESLTSTENTKTDSTSNIVSNKRVLHSTGVRLSTSASGSQLSGNTRNDKIQQTPSSNSKNKVEAHPRNVKSSLNKRNGTVKVNGSASVQNSKKHDNSDYVCINGDDCMSSDNLCVSNSMNDVKFRAKPKKRKSKKEIWKPTGKVFTKIGYIWRPTGRTFTIVGNACPLTRITTTNEVPSRKPIVLESESPKPVVNLVYSRKPRKNKNTESVSKTKVVQIVLWYLDSGCSKHMTGDHSQLTNFISKFLGTVKFGNDQVAKIMGYGDYQIGNVTISRVYYVEGLGHNLFSVGQFCDSNLEVAFRQYTLFICNREGVDLLTGSRGDNL